jgi:hypothetical protein
MRRLLATSILLAMLAPDRSRAEPSGARRPILLVVAASSPVTNLSLDEVKRIFSGARHELRPLNLPPGAEERVALDRMLLGREPDDVSRYWLDRKIRGQGGPPRVITNGRLVAKIVARVPGTIGYTVDPALPPETVAIRVNGLAPTDPRYPLLLPARPSR